MGDDHFIRPDNDQERECAECVLPNVCLNQGRCLLLEEEVNELPKIVYYFTPEEEAARRHLLDLIEIERRRYQTMIEPYLKQLGAIHGRPRVVVTESTMEHIARDIRDRIFPKKSEDTGEKKDTENG